MLLTINALRLYRFDPDALRSLVPDAMDDVLIPEDIGAMSRVDGFLAWSDELSTVLRVEGTVMLRHGRATKVVPRERLKAEVRKRADAGDAVTPQLQRDVQEALLCETHQTVASYPVILDRATGFAMFCCQSDAQAHNAKIQLQALVPALCLEPIRAHRVADRLCAWLEQKVPLPEHVVFGRRVDLENPIDKSVTSLRAQPLPNQDVLTQIRERNRFVAKLALAWRKRVSFVVEDPLGLIGITPQGELRARLDQLKVVSPAMVQLEQSTKAWLNELRPLVSALVIELGSQSPGDHGSEQPPAPFVFDGLAA